MQRTPAPPVPAVWLSAALLQGPPLLLHGDFSPELEIPGPLKLTSAWFNELSVMERLSMSGVTYSEQSLVWCWETCPNIDHISLAKTQVVGSHLKINQNTTQLATVMCHKLDNYL